MATFVPRVARSCTSTPTSRIIHITTRHLQLSSCRTLPQKLQRSFPSVSRHFGTTSSLKSRIKTKPSAGATKSNSTNYLPSHASYANTLASRSAPVLLYLAPTDNTYQLACYLVGGFCIAYGCFHFYDVIILPRPGLPAAVTYLMGSVTVIFMGLGGWMLLGARRLVGSINAIPKAGAGVTLRLEARRFFPVFGRAKTIDCAPEDMALRQRLQHVRFASESDPYPTAGKRPLSARERRVEAEKKEQERRQYELDHAYSGPIRHTWSALKGLRQGLGRIVRRDGFVGLSVKGKGTWKIDAKNGWCLDEGLALDRLLKAK